MTKPNLAAARAFDVDHASRAAELTRQHTAASSFAELIGPFGHHWRPTFRRADGPELCELADLYDAAQAARGDARRAYRGEEHETHEPGCPWCTARNGCTNAASAAFMRGEAEQ